MSRSNEPSTSEQLPHRQPLMHDGRINDFAIRSFRDVADEDYIAARLAFRAGLPHASLWQSQQTIEKYLKCILLLHRIPATDVRHSLRKGYDRIQESGKATLEISDTSLDFLREIDETGTFRYFEISIVWTTKNLFSLDRLVWELRRYCTLDSSYAALRLTQGVLPTSYSLPAGRLEEIESLQENPAREPLLWKNGHFGKRRRHKLKFKNSLILHNSPLYMYPEMLDELIGLVYLPKQIINGYRKHKAPDFALPPDS